MSRIANPYFAGPPATHPETFFGRQDVLRFVDETLASPMHNVIVFYGQRRIGKTSILHQIAHGSGQDYQAVLFDVQSSLDKPAQQLFYGLAREVARQLNLPTPDRDDFRQDPDAFRTIFLPKVYAHLGDRRLLLLLDEFDALSLETAPAELDAVPFVEALNRIVQSDDKRVVFLFVVGRRFKDLSSYQLQIFRGGRDRQIGLLKQDATLQLIKRPAQDVLTYQETAIERIWTLASGHPYFTQLLCQEIFNQAQRQDLWTVTGAEVEAVTDDAINAGQGALQWFWDDVPPVERFSLYTIGQLAAEKGRATLDQLIAQRDLQRVQVSDIELRALPDQLVDRQVLKRDREGHYCFAVELVRRWIVSSHSLEEVTTELTRVAVDESARAYLRAGLAAYRADDSEFAIESFSRALSINPDYVEARLWLARTRAKAGDLLGAIDDFAYVERFGGREAREAHLGLADTRAEYGQQLEELGKIEEAVQEYRRVLELDERHTLASNRLSEIIRQRADERLASEGIAAAQSLYEQALGHNPSPALQGQVKEHLDQYSQTQKELHNWEEAERASHLSATLTSKAGDGQETLLRVRLERGHWHLDQGELDAATDVYRRVLEEADDDAPRQMIENDILRFSQQQEDNKNWPQSEAAQGLLIELFPDDPENRTRLGDALCRQAEYHLDQNDLGGAKAAYQRALTANPSNQAVPKLTRDGFQAYRQVHLGDSTSQGRKLIAEAMTVFVDLAGQEDIQAYQWLSTARAELGDALYQEDKLAEAHTAYLQALDDTTHLLQLVSKTDRTKEAGETYRQRAVIWLKLGQVELDRGEFDEAIERFRQSLVDAASGQEIVDQIKRTFGDYRQRQEEILHWDHARRAIEVLGRLFPDDKEVKFWLAETRAALADWHLQRAIPDPDEAWRLARQALDVALPFQKADLIVNRIKVSFRDRCRQYEEASPPNWAQAERVMNRLVSLLPGDTSVNRWLADTRLRQGDWCLTQGYQSPGEAQSYLAQTAEIYKRALSDLPNDDQLITHLKTSLTTFRDQCERSDPPDFPLAEKSMRILADLLPEDQEVQQWLAEAKKKAIPERRVGQRWAVAAVALVLILCLGIGLVPGIRGQIYRSLGIITPTNTPAAIVSNTSTSIPTPTPAATPLAQATGIPTPSPTPTATPLTEIPTTTRTVTAVPSHTSTPVTAPPTLTPTDTPIPSPKVALKCNPSDGSSLRPAGTAALAVEIEGMSNPTFEWTAVNGSLNPSGGATTIYTAPNTPGIDVVSVTVKDDDHAWTLSCSYNVLPYPAPQVISPPLGASFSGAGILPELAWEPVAGLGPGDYYLVSLNFTRDGRGYKYEWQLKVTTWQVPIEVFHLADPAPGDLLERKFQWQVGVAKNDDNGRPVEVGECSEPRTFTWEPIPLPGGAALDVEIDPGNDLRVLAALREKGIYRTDNGGIDWQLVASDLAVEVLHIAPANPKIVYAGTYAYMLKSEDQGKTWQPWRIPPDAQIHAIATDPDNAQIVFVATDRGVMRSDSGGQNWLTLDRGDGQEGEILDRAFYSIVAARTPGGNRVYVAGEGDQIYWRGTDDTTAPWKETICAVCSPPIFALAVFTPPQQPNKLLAGSDRANLAISLNAGDEWIPVLIPTSIAKLKLSALAIDPTNPQIIYAGSGTHWHPTDAEGLYRSQDGGLTWQAFNAWQPSGAVAGIYAQGIALSPKQSQLIWIATSEGVFSSDDGGLSWVKWSARGSY